MSNLCLSFIKYITIFNVVVIFTFVVKATEVTKVKFGNTSINIPSPNGYCLLGNTTNEKRILKYQQEVQFNIGNKILQYWVDCKQQKQIINNELVGDLTKWFIILGTLSGKQKLETTFPNYSPKDFKKLYLKDWDFNKITENVNKLTKKSFQNYLYDNKLSQPVNLGVLSVTDSVHMGILMKVGETNPRAVLGLLSFALIKGVPTGFHFYSQYENKTTIKRLLSEAEYFSAKLANIN